MPSKDANGAAHGGLESLRVPGRAGLASLLAALVPVLLICLLATPVYPMSPDEQVQQLYASGRFLGAGQQLLMPYSLVTISAPLSLLYALLPAVPWYALTLLSLTVASFAVAWDKTLRSRMSARLCAVTLSVLVVLEVISTLYLTYTIVAFLAVGAGLMLVLGRAAFDEPGGVHATDVSGMALVVAGYSLRPESGLAAIAVFAPFAIWVLVRNRNAGSIMRGIVVVALVGVCALAGRFAYDHTPGWEGFSAYLDAGRSALDYPDLPADAVRSVEPSLTDNDVDVLYNWLFADDDVFGTEFFERLGQRVDHLGLSNLASSLRAKTTYLMLGLVALVGVYAWALVRDLDAGRGALAAGIVLMLLVSAGMLVLRARVRLHVVIPLVVMGVFALVSLAAGSEEPVGRHAAARLPRAGVCPVWLSAVCVVLALAACGGFWLKVARPLTVRAGSPTIEAARSYVDENPTSSSCSAARRRSCSPARTPCPSRAGTTRTTCCPSAAGRTTPPRGGASLRVGASRTTTCSSSSLSAPTWSRCSSPRRWSSSARTSPSTAATPCARTSCATSAPARQTRASTSTSTASPTSPRCQGACQRGRVPLACQRGRVPLAGTLAIKAGPRRTHAPSGPCRFAGVVLAAPCATCPEACGPGAWPRRRPGARASRSSP